MVAKVAAAKVIQRQFRKHLRKKKFYFRKHVKKKRKKKVSKKKIDKAIKKAKKMSPLLAKFMG